MAKKPGQKPSGEQNLKPLIRKLVIKEGELVKELSDVNIQFGFAFTYPKGKDPNTNKPKGPLFQILKPKNESFLSLNSKSKLTEEFIKQLQAKNLLDQYFIDVQKILLTKNVDFQLIRNDKEQLFIMFDRIFLDNNIISLRKEFVYHIRNMFFSGLYSVILLSEKIKGKSDLKDSGFSPYHI